MSLSFSSALRSASYWFDFDRVEAREHLRLHFLEAGQRLGSRLRRVGDRVADLRVGELLDAGDDEPDLACGQLLARHALRREHADLLAAVHGAGGHEAELVARAAACR